MIDFGITMLGQIKLAALEFGAVGIGNSDGAGSWSDSHSLDQVDRDCEREDGVQGVIDVLKDGLDLKMKDLVIESSVKIKRHEQLRDSN
jgi:hypothetical protein